MSCSVNDNTFVKTYLVDSYKTNKLKSNFSSAAISNRLLSFMTFCSINQLIMKKETVKNELIKQEDLIDAFFKDALTKKYPFKGN